MWKDKERDRLYRDKDGRGKEEGERYGEIMMGGRGKKERENQRKRGAGAEKRQKVRKEKRRRKEREAAKGETRTKRGKAERSPRRLTNGCPARRPTLPLPQWNLRRPLRHKCLRDKRRGEGEADPSDAKAVSKYLLLPT